MNYQTMIIMEIDHSPAVLLPDVLEHVDVEGRVEGDVRHQLQRLLAHHRLLVVNQGWEWAFKDDQSS